MFFNSEFNFLYLSELINENKIYHRFKIKCFVYLIYRLLISNLYFESLFSIFDFEFEKNDLERIFKEFVSWI